MDSGGSLTASLWAMIEAAQASANQEEPGDYVKDGLLYCGKCHTPKQAIVNVCGETRTIFAACECKDRQNKKEEADLKMHERRQRIEQLRKAAFSESDMQSWTFENDDSPNCKPSQIARNYTKNFREMMERGKGLIFYGTVGTGKTYLAACIANALIDKGIPCIATYATEIWSGLLIFLPFSGVAEASTRHSIPHVTGIFRISPASMNLLPARLMSTAPI